MESMHDLEILIESGRKLIILETEREGCFIEGFRRLAKRSTHAYYQWRLTQGLERLAPGYEAQIHNRDIGQLFGQILSTELQGVYVLVDFHHHLNDPLAIRFIKDVHLQTPQHTLILLSATIKLPDDLRPYATHYKLPLPTPGQLKRLARRAIWNDGIINHQDLADVAKHKFELLNDNNVLNLQLDYEELDNIAGFAKLKDWLQVRKPVFKGEVSLPGGDIPKGMLLLGVQGCGKSMAAKAVAGSWKLPLLHLDFGTMYNRFYGQTEENMRTALAVAEQMAPCVLWLDEIEKGLSAVSSTDDVSKRLLGTFLTWLAEKSQAVFVVATANDVSALPPELLRKGRLRAIANQTNGFSGAELEQLIVSAIYQSYSQQDQLSTELLSELATQTQPLSVLMAEKIQALRAWAEHRAVKVS